MVVNCNQFSKFEYRKEEPPNNHAPIFTDRCALSICLLDSGATKENRRKTKASYLLHFDVDLCNYFSCLMPVTTI
jgi:hypothetical protein